MIELYRQLPLIEGSPHERVEDNVPEIWLYLSDLEHISRSLNNDLSLDSFRKEMIPEPEGAIDIKRRMFHIYKGNQIDMFFKLSIAFLRMKLAGKTKTTANQISQYFPPYYGKTPQFDYKSMEILFNHCLYRSGLSVWRQLLMMYDIWRINCTPKYTKKSRLTRENTDSIWFRPEIRETIIDTIVNLKELCRGVKGEELDFEPMYEDRRSTQMKSEIMTQLLDLQQKVQFDPLFTIKLLLWNEDMTHQVRLFVRVQPDIISGHSVFDAKSKVEKDVPLWREFEHALAKCAGYIAAAPTAELKREASTVQMTHLLELSNTPLTHIYPSQQLKAGEMANTSYSDITESAADAIVTLHDFFYAVGSHGEDYKNSLKRRIKDSKKSGPVVPRYVYNPKGTWSTYDWESALAFSFHRRGLTVPENEELWRFFMPEHETLQQLELALAEC